MKGTLPGPGGILTIHRAFTQKPTTEAFLSTVILLPSNPDRGDIQLDSAQSQPFQQHDSRHRAAKSETLKLSRDHFGRGYQTPKCRIQSDHQHQCCPPWVCIHSTMTRRPIVYLCYVCILMIDPHLRYLLRQSIRRPSRSIYHLTITVLDFPSKAAFRARHHHNLIKK
jgi:hypothetical protein